MNKKANTSEPNVEIRAQTIAYKMEGSILKSMACDFELHELGETIGVTDLGDPEVLFELDARITTDQALTALKAVIENIETNGLPQTKLVVPRQTARVIEQAQRATKEVNESWRKLPPEIREHIMPGMADSNLRFGLTSNKGGK